tara:strand:+ start:415 stop:1545 length:1131 start_codon:yes stop_codon:yes gene_type:complete
MIKIPFNKPFFTGNELENIKEVLNSGKVSGDGKFSKECQNIIENKFNTEKAFLTNSCTDALELSAILINIKKSDEVILPSFTFPSTANAFILRGAKPIFVDIREDTLNMDENIIEEKITENTKAIIPVHYAGVGCEMDKINEISKRHNLHVIEDAAQGVNAKYKNKYLGAIGDIGAYSFHETKNYNSGEGGAILLNNKLFIERTEIIREKGTNRSKFLKGQVDKYTWVDIGSSFLLSDILSSILQLQLKNLDSIQDKRKLIYEHYYNNLKDLQDQGKITLPTIPDHCDSNFHSFHIILKNQSERDKVMKFLNDNGIQAVFHFIPLHNSPMGKSFGNESLPLTESISSRILRLPFYADLKIKEVDYITSNLKKIIGS